MQDLICIDAWRDLGTCRSIGMAAGPIPFTAAIAWANHHDLDREATELLWQVVRFLDGERAEREAAERRLQNMRGPTP